MFRKIRLTLIIIVIMLMSLFTGCIGGERYGRYEDADLYTIGSANISAQLIKKIEIDWVDGSVEVEQTASNTISIVEEREPESEDKRMRYYVDGEVLKIKYCKSGLRSAINAEEKNLCVGIPAGVSLEIESKSALITMGVLELNEFSVESTTGSVTIERIAANEAEIETAIGRVFIGEIVANTASFESVSASISVARLSVDFFNVETKSGDISFGLQKALTGEIESVTADVTFTLAAGLGAEVCMKTATGKLKTEREYEKSGCHYKIYGAEEGDAVCQIEVETFRGNVYVN